MNTIQPTLGEHGATPSVFHQHHIGRVPLFFENLGYRLRGSPFRAFVHPTELVDQLIREAGTSLVFRRQTLMWQVVVYQRQNAGA